MHGNVDNGRSWRDCGRRPILSPVQDNWGEVESIPIGLQVTLVFKKENPIRNIGTSIPFHLPYEYLGLQKSLALVSLLDFTRCL
jgi:hypothetical protein